MRGPAGPAGAAGPVGAAAGVSGLRRWPLWRCYTWLLEGMEGMKVEQGWGLGLRARERRGPEGDELVCYVLLLLSILFSLVLSFCDGDGMVVYG